MPIILPISGKGMALLEVNFLQILWKHIRIKFKQEFICTDIHCSRLIDACIKNREYFEMESFRNIASSNGAMEF
jgi:hypothetical protein